MKSVSQDINESTARLELSCHNGGRADPPHLLPAHIRPPLDLDCDNKRRARHLYRRCLEGQMAVILWCTHVIESALTTIRIHRYLTASNLPPPPLLPSPPLPSLSATIPIHPSPPLKFYARLRRGLSYPPPPPMLPRHIMMLSHRRLVVRAYSHAAQRNTLARRGGVDSVESGQLRLPNFKRFKKVVVISATHHQPTR